MFVISWAIIKAFQTETDNIYGVSTHLINFSKRKISKKSYTCFCLILNHIHPKCSDCGFKEEVFFELLQKITHLLSGFSANFLYTNKVDDKSDCEL